MAGGAGGVGGPAQGWVFTQLPSSQGGEGEDGAAGMRRQRESRRVGAGRRALPFQKPSHEHAPVPGTKLHIWSHFPGRREKKKSLSKNIFSSSPHLGLEQPGWVTAREVVQATCSRASGSTKGGEETPSP